MATSVVWAFRSASQLPALSSIRKGSPSLTKGLQTVFGDSYANHPPRLLQSSGRWTLECPRGISGGLDFVCCKGDRVAGDSFNAFHIVYCIHKAENGAHRCSFTRSQVQRSWSSRSLFRDVLAILWYEQSDTLGHRIALRASKQYSGTI